MMVFGHYMPWVSLINTFVEISNGVFILILNYHLFYMTDFVNNIDVK